MNTDRLFEFQILAQTLHFGRASKKLFMAQSVLSRHIQDMEEELGVRLFVRGPHGVNLTNAGITLYRLSWPLLQAEARSREILLRALPGTEGSVNFAILRPVMQDTIEDFFGRFEDIYPEITLNIKVINDHEHETLEDFHCLATTSAALSIPDCFRLKKILHEKCWLVMPVKYKSKPGSSISLRDLSGETLFLPGLHSSIGSYAVIRQQAEAATSGRVNIVHVASPETALVNVNLGRGFTIIPRHRLEERSRNINHAMLKEDVVFETLLYHNEKSGCQAAELFEDEFIKWMSEE